MIKIAMKSRPFLEKNDDIVDKLSIEWRRIAIENYFRVESKYL